MLHRNAALLTCLVMAGCSSLPKARAPTESATTSAETVQAALLAGYMEALQTVVQGSPAEQAEVMAEARSNYEQARQGPAVLRYALLLATPGHPARDLPLAQRLLHDALARPDLLSPIERALAIVETARVEDELQLAAENGRLVAEAQQERERQRNAATPNAALARRLQDEMSESARLRKELDEAKAKLQAIANIERNIPERPPAPETRKP
jgi:uncharacterized protein YceK